MDEAKMLDILYPKGWIKVSNGEYNMQVIAKSSNYNGRAQFKAYDYGFANIDTRNGITVILT